MSQEPKNQTTATATPKYVSAANEAVAAAEVTLSKAKDFKTAAGKAATSEQAAADAKRSYEQKLNEAKTDKQNMRYKGLELTWYGQLLHRLTFWR